MGTEEKRGTTFRNKETKLRIHNITAKVTLKFGNEAWVLKKREEQRLETTQMKFLRHLLGISKLDKEKDRLCGLVVRVSGYRYRGPGFDPRRYQIF